MDQDAQDAALLNTLEQAARGDLGGAFPDFSALLGKYGEKLCLADTLDEFFFAYPGFRDHFVNLDIDTVLDIADQPGTHLRTARCLDFLDPVVRLRGVITLLAIGVAGLVVIGGDGSFNGAMRLCELGMPCIGIPGTIDNDLAYTEMTLGYDTAVNVCMQAVRQIRATSRSHDRPHVVEVMGRACGAIAMRTAAATGAEIVIVPEMPWSIEEVAQKLQRQIDKGNTRATVIVAEGAYASMAPFDVYGFLMERGKQCYPGETISALRLASILKRLCHDAAGEYVEARSTVLGYTQRGESPSAYDAAFAFEAGNRAVSLLREGKGNLVIGVREGSVFSMPIVEALAQQKREHKNFNQELYGLLNEL
ncbi:MAG: ATP-dependent 6-phosphofructokinase [Oscillospiraceae bacterium]|nr:ATP-dependent 6-phosphofructokinase [Oscillospiraceae bacterium]